MTPLTSATRAHNVHKTLAHNPAVAAGIRALGGAVLNEGIVAPRLREIAILRMGWNCQSRYEFGQHTLVARSLGMSEAEILHLTRPPETWPWAPGELAIIAMVDDLHADDCVSDTTWQELEEHYSHAEILELMTAALCYRLVSGLLNSCGVELDDGVPGWPDPTA